MNICWEGMKRYIKRKATTTTKRTKKEKPRLYRQLLVARAKTQFKDDNGR